MKNMFATARSGFTTGFIKSATLALLGVAVCAGWAPSAQAVSTASVTSSLSFTVNASAGTLSFGSDSGQASVYVYDNALYSSDNQYGSPDTSANATATGNLASSSLGRSGNSFSASSAMSLALPPSTFAYGGASTYGYTYLTNTNRNAFTLRVDSFAAILDFDLATDANGLYSYGSAFWTVSLHYSVPTGGGDKYDQFSESHSITSNDIYSDQTEDTDSLSFKVAKNATSLYLIWQTGAFAEVGDNTPINVPDGGSTVALLGLALTGVGGLHRKFSGARGRK
ncbi:MAG: motif [Chthoniobacter sp.]|nr:motif [Chthoniobacter sp.]